MGHSLEGVPALSGWRELRCEVLVASKDGPRAIDSLTAQGIKVAPGDPVDFDGGLAVPLATVLGVPSPVEADIQAVIVAHTKLLKDCLDELRIVYVLGGCVLQPSVRRAVWLDVYSTGSLMRTGVRIRAASEDDVDEKLTALAALRGKERTDFTVLPPPDWPTH